MTTEFKLYLQSLVRQLEEKQLRYPTHIESPDFPDLENQMVIGDYYEDE